MMERITRFTPAYDHRKEGGGVHCVDLYFVLKGPKGAIELVIFTGWMLSHVHERLKEKGEFPIAQAARLGWHSPTPIFEDQQPSNDTCNYLDGLPCYCDWSYLRGGPQSQFEVLVEQGSDGVWASLQEEYDAIFGEEERDETVAEGTGGDE